MWTRKNEQELSFDCSKRRKKVRVFYYVILFLSFLFVVNDFLKFESFSYILKSEPERLTLLLIPFFVFFLHRNYVATGSMKFRQEKMCLTCEKGIGLNDKVWAFRSYGKDQKKWYQSKACESTDSSGNFNNLGNCDLVAMHLVKFNHDSEAE